jgi:hypothetical protein
MPLAQLVHPVERLTGTAGPRRRRNGEERVGDLAHRRHDDHWTTPVPSARSPDDVDQTSDRFWIGDRRAAEFLYDQSR